MERERAYNLNLGVEKPFSNEPFLKDSIFPTSHSLILNEFCQSLDAIHNLSPLTHGGKLVFKSMGGYNRLRIS